MTLTQREMDELSIMALSEVHMAIAAFQEDFLRERKSLVERAYPGAMRKPDQMRRPAKEVKNVTKR